MNVRIPETCAAIAFGVVAIVSAQDSPLPQTSSSQTSSSAQTSSRSVAVIGCLQRGNATAGTASSSRTASAGGYLLMNATMPSRATTTAGAAMQYRLDGDDSRLSSHLGHKVEIAGTLEESASASSSSTAGSATSTAAMSSPRLKVDSVRMVSSTCP